LVIFTQLAILFISTAHAETNFNISTGFSYINQQNLQSSQAANTAGTVTTDRTGWLVGGRWDWQQLDARGGYSLTAQASLDKGLSGAGNIRSLGLNGAWMHALNANWLTRFNLKISDYQDDDQPAYNNQAAGAGLTLGWFGKQNTGLDINVAWQQEQYEDDPSMAYEADRFTFGGRYYFAHQRNRPYWSLGTELSRFDSDKIARYSYNSARLNLAYNDWHWKEIEGNLLLSWCINQFDETLTISSPMNNNTGIPVGVDSGMNGISPPPPNIQSSTQKDSYLTTSLDLRYPLNKQSHLVSNLNIGQYRSNLAEDRPLLSAYLGIGIKY